MVSPGAIVPSMFYPQFFEIEEGPTTTLSVIAGMLDNLDELPRSLEHTLFELQLSERRLAIATHAAKIGIWDWNLQTGDMVYSDLAKAICGFHSNEPVTFEMVAAVTHPEDLPRTHQMAMHAIDPDIRASGVYRYRIVRADTGEVRWVLAHGEATFGEVDGKTVALNYTGTLIDITDEAEAAEALVQSEARLKLAVEAGQMAVWELDLKTGTVTPSPELNRLFGYPEEYRPSADDLRSRYADGERERIEAEGAAARARGDTQMQTEIHIVLPNSEDRWVLLRAASNASDPTRIIGVVMDITDRKRAEERTALVAHELQHRLKNTLAVIQTLASQSFRGRTDARSAAEAFDGRLTALAKATDLITANHGTTALIRDIVERCYQPFPCQCGCFRDRRTRSFHSRPASRPCRHGDSRALYQRCQIRGTERAWWYRPFGVASRWRVCRAHLA